MKVTINCMWCKKDYDVEVNMEKIILEQHEEEIRCSHCGIKTTLTFKLTKKVGGENEQEKST